MNKRLLAFLPLLALAGLLGVLGYYNLHKKPKYEPRAMVGKSLPEVTLAALSDQAPTDIVAVAKAYNRPVVLNMFASWCAPCAAENPELMTLKKQGVIIIGVAWKDDPKATQNFLNLHQDPYSVVLSDPDGKLALALGVTGVPESFIVQPDGTISEKIAGPILPETVPMVLETVKR